MRAQAAAQPLQALACTPFFEGRGEGGGGGPEHPQQKDVVIIGDAPIPRAFGSTPVPPIYELVKGLTFHEIDKSVDEIELTSQSSTKLWVYTFVFLLRFAVCV